MHNNNNKYNNKTGAVNNNYLRPQDLLLFFKLPVARQTIF